MQIFWARLASFDHLGLVSDPLIVSKFHNETHDPKGHENKIYTTVRAGKRSTAATQFQSPLYLIVMHLIFYIYRLAWPGGSGAKIIHERPRHPQPQGLVERSH